MALSDSTGNILATYSYDEWGEVTVNATGEENIALANVNPLRYRGYYYDNETDYYYLQSRYYAPNICRFINADLPEYAQLQKNEQAGINLFAYCCNEPINRSDPNGQFGTPIQWACAIIGGIVGVPFGKWLANKLGYYKGAKYIAIRAAAIVGGAALGWFAGTLIMKLATSFLYSHTAVLAKLPKFVVWFLGVGSNSTIANQVYNNNYTHIFSQNHVKNGIMQLGSSKRQIFNQAFEIVRKKLIYAQNGSNQIHTYINGKKVTIKFYYEDGVIKSFDMFVGWASRIVGKLLK